MLAFAEAESGYSKEIKLKVEGEQRLGKIAEEKKVVVQNLKQQTDDQRKKFQDLNGLLGSQVGKLEVQIREEQVKANQAKYALVSLKNNSQATKDMVSKKDAEARNLED